MSLHTTLRSLMKHSDKIFLVSERCRGTSPRSSSPISRTTCGEYQYQIHETSFTRNKFLLSFSSPNIRRKNIKLPMNHFSRFSSQKLFPPVVSFSDFRIQTIPIFQLLRGRIRLRLRQHRRPHQELQAEAVQVQGQEECEVH